MWVKVGNLWQLLAQGTPAVDATSSSYSYTWNAGTEMRVLDLKLLFGGHDTRRCSTANIGGFVASASKAGGISISWTIDGTMLSDDRVGAVSVKLTLTVHHLYQQVVSNREFLIHCSRDKIQSMVPYVSAAVCNGALCSNEHPVQLLLTKRLLQLQQLI